MERLITIPIEIALNGMPGLHRLRSTTIAGLSDIKCVFTYGTDYFRARQEVINRIAMIANLPANTTPTLSPWSPTGEIVRYVLEGPGYTLNELKAVQDWVLERQLKTVPGVIDVTGFGGTVKQYQVLVDPWQLATTASRSSRSRMRSPNRTPTSAETSSRWAASRTTCAGSDCSARVKTHSTRHTRPPGRYRRKKLEGIRNVVITQYQGNPILVQSRRQGGRGPSAASGNHRP